MDAGRSNGSSFVFSDQLTSLKSEGITNQEERRGSYPN